MPKQQYNQMMKIFSVLLVNTLFFLPLINAQVIKDPMRPINWVDPAAKKLPVQEEVKETSTDQQKAPPENIIAVEEKTRYELNATIIPKRRGRAYAFINNNKIYIGDRINDLTLVSITRKYVILNDLNGNANKLIAKQFVDIEGLRKK